MFLSVVFIKWEQYHRTQMVCLCYTNIAYSTKMRTKRKHRKMKKMFSKRISRKADLHKPVINKIITTYAILVYLRWHKKPNWAYSFNICQGNSLVLILLGSMGFRIRPLTFITAALCFWHKISSLQEVW